MQPKTNHERRLPPEVAAWGAVSFFSDLAHESVSCLLPALLAATGAPALGLGLVEGVSDAGATVAKLVGGRAADRSHRPRALAAAGYALTAIAIPAIALVRSAPAIAVLRLAGWMGRGFRSPLRDTLLSRAVPAGDRGRAFGVERAMDQTGAVLAPLGVAALLGLGFEVREIVGLTLAPGLLALACVLLYIRERSAAPPSPETAGRLPATREGELLPQTFRRFLAAVGLFGCGDFAKTLLILWAVGEEPDPLSAWSRGAVLYALLNALSVSSAWAGGSLSDRLGRKPVLLAAYACGLAAASIPVISSPGIATGVAALALSGILIGAEESVERAWASDLAGPRPGSTFGKLHAVNGIGDLVASAGVGLIWTLVGPRAAFASACVLMAAGMLLFLRVEDPRRAARA